MLADRLWRLIRALRHDCYLTPAVGCWRESEERKPKVAANANVTLWQGKKSPQSGTEGYGGEARLLRRPCARVGNSVTRLCLNSCSSFRRRRCHKVMCR